MSNMMMMIMLMKLPLCRYCLEWHSLLDADEMVDNSSPMSSMMNVHHHHQSLLPGTDEVDVDDCVLVLAVAVDVETEDHETCDAMCVATDESSEWVDGRNNIDVENPTYHQPFLCKV
jgi:hypothetical protein